MNVIKNLTYMFIILIPFNVVIAQTPLEKETYEDAEYFFAQEDYSEALISYLQLYKRSFKDNCNINYKIGICFLYSSVDKIKAIPYLEKAITSISPKYKESIKEVNAPFDTYLYLGNAYRINMQHDKAIESYNKYLNLIAKEKGSEVEKEWAKNQIEACKRAKIATNKPNRLKITSISKSINTKDANINPAISSDESTIVFVTKQKFYDAIMYSKFKKGKWEVPYNITPDIMSDGNQYPVFLSADGKTLLLSYLDGENCDIYLARMEGKKWTPSLPISKEINSKYWESHASLSPDGKTIYFTSNRQQSLGGLDIFYTNLNNNGEWGPVVNIGKEINTIVNEETPCISAGGDTLYFSSQGHDCIGGYDIFYSIKGKDGKWSNPVNMGYPLNTTDDDLFFNPVANKNFGYQSRFIKEGAGDLDIVKLEFFSDDHPYKFNIVGNLMKFIKKSRPEKYRLVLTDKEANPKHDTIKANSDGNFTFNQVAGTYQVVFLSDSFVAISNTFVIPENYPAETYTLTPEILYEFTPIAIPILAANTSTPDSTIYLEKPGVKKVAESEKPIIIHNILFNFNASKLNKDTEEELKLIASLIKNDATMQIEIIGHTDAQGSAAYNQKLSEKRAVVVRDKLVEFGAPAKRIKTSGKGLNEPIAINENPDGSDNPIGRAFNRRAEFKLVKSSNKKIVVDAIKVPEDMKPAKKK
jgi:outer membrane protein OmpA-like peptidoglycan-associated protein